MVAQGSQNERMKKYLKRFANVNLSLIATVIRAQVNKKYCVAPYLVSLWTQCSRYSRSFRIIHRISSFLYCQEIKKKRYRKWDVHSHQSLDLIASMLFKLISATK